MTVNSNTDLKPETSKMIELLNTLKGKYTSIPANELQRRTDSLKEIKRITSIAMNKLGDNADTLTDLNIIRRWIDIETINLIEDKIKEARSRQRKDNDRDDI